MPLQFSFFTMRTRSIYKSQGYGTARRIMSRKSSKLSIIEFCLSLLTLLAGSTIYILFRQNVIFLSGVDLQLLEMIHIHIPDGNSSFLLYWFIYCLPDGLWYAALLLMLSAFENDSTSGIRLPFLLGIILPFLMEGFQYLGIVSGTFDIYDIITYLITLLIFMLWKKLKISFR